MKILKNNFEDFSSARCILSQSKLSPNHTISGLKRLPQIGQQGSSETGIFAPGQSGSGAPEISFNPCSVFLRNYLYLSRKHKLGYHNFLLFDHNLYILCDISFHEALLHFYSPPFDEVHLHFE